MSPEAPSAPMSESPEFVGRAWFVRVRGFAALLGMGIVMAASVWSDWDSAAARVLLLLAFMLVSNLALWRRLQAGRGLANGTIAAVLGLDILLLTAIFALTGGASNPFSSAYLLYVAVAALLLPPTLTSSVVVVAVASYSGLFWLDSSSEHAGHHSMRLHLMGMWVAFVVVGPVVAYAITRLRRVAADAEADLSEARRRQERAEKLSALATLSAGAAHELSTPLGTIAVIAKELERRELDAELTEDARLIREEIDRCSKILSQLAVDVGAGIGEASQAVRVGDLVSDLMATSEGIRVEASPAVQSRSITLPRRLSTQALRGLLKNARQASSGSQEIELRLCDDEDSLVVEVADHGCGMNSEVQDRAGEPFFTTKATGEGMGLGLFFARSVTEHLGGELEIDSEQGRGTIVSVRIPWAAQGLRMSEGEHECRG
jgi:two-component system sensor histidine kinase RegB